MKSTKMITIENIKEAKRNLENIAQNTPLTKAPILSETFNSEIFFQKKRIFNLLEVLN